MQAQETDTNLETLLDLDGQVFLINEKTRYWVKFVVKRVPATAVRPQGLSYALTLHNADNERVLGFDNAHAIKPHPTHDHLHEGERVKPYPYTDAITLLQDFWQAVDKHLQQEGIIS